MAAGKKFEQVGRPPADTLTGKNTPAPDASWQVPGTVPPRKGGSR